MNPDVPRPSWYTPNLQLSNQALPSISSYRIDCLPLLLGK